MAQKDRCYVCGSISLNPIMLTCIDCCPYLYKKGRYPHQLLRRSTEWKEKKLKKLEEVSNKCEQCGMSDQPLSLYHIEEVNLQTYQDLWEGAVKWRLLNYLFKKPDRVMYADLYLDRESKKQYKEQLDYFEMRRETEERGCFTYSESGKAKTLQAIDTYKNLINTDNLYNKIGLDTPKLRIISGVYDKVVLYKLISKLLLFIFEDIQKEYDNRVQTMLTKYLDFNNTIVLCKKCHSAD